MSDFDEPIVPCPYCGLPMPESVCERLRPADPPAWVEQLAEKWESEYGSQSVGSQCALELRERAKGPAR